MDVLCSKRRARPELTLDSEDVFFGVRVLRVGIDPEPGKAGWPTGLAALLKLTRSDHVRNYRWWDVQQVIEDVVEARDHWRGVPAVMGAQHSPMISCEVPRGAKAGRERSIRVRLRTWR